MTDSVLIEELEAAKGKIGILQLDSPKNLNSLTLDMVRALAKQLSIWEEDNEIAIVILKASGDKAFCAGANIQELYRSATEKPGGPCEYGETFFLEEYKLDFQIHNFPKPILCIGHGIVMGGGLGLMTGASHRVVTEQSRIAMPEISIGLYPDVGGTFFLSGFPYNLGYFFALTGAPLNANDAIFTKLADICINSENLDKLNNALLATEWSEENANHQLLTNILGEYGLGKKDLNLAIPSKIRPHLSELERICQAHSLAEMIDGIEKIETEDDWLNKAKSSLASGSPLSSLLIYEQIKRHKCSDLRTAFQSEYQLSTNVIRYPEFAEGVRALLIDKDKSPKWQFSHFSGVPSSLINKMFSAPWETNPLDDII